MIPKKSLIRYTITTAAEEGPCPQCGWELYRGETVWETEFDACFCSPWCARDHRAKAIANITQPSPLPIS
jgi:hypothetical protein